jgi:hypothetical protein
MFKKILLATVAVVGLAGAAHAQRVDILCGQPEQPGLTVNQQQAGRLACASPRLKANAERNMLALSQFLGKLSAADRVELLEWVKARGIEIAAYCQVSANSQLTPQMEDCLAYWQDWSYSEIQRSEHIVDHAQTWQAIGNILGALANGVAAYMQDRAAMQPAPMYQPATIAPQSCMALPNGRGWMMSCY